MHVVNISADTDNLTGDCKGKATVVIRSKGMDDERVQKMKNDFKEKGVKVSESVEEKESKSKYENLSKADWKDTKIKAKVTNSSARERKLGNLESATGIVGNAGRWGDEWKKKSIKQAIDPQFSENFKWQKTKNPKKEIP